MSYEPTVWVDGDHVTSAKLNKLEQGVNSMSYVPTVWSAGDVVTAEKLNKLEQGVAEGGGGGGNCMVIEYDSETYELNKTWQEISDALAGCGVGNVVIVDAPNVDVGAEVVSRAYVSGEEYVIEVYDNYSLGSKSNKYYASSENGYPVFD